MAYISPLVKLFGKSPFKPLHEHILKVNECVNQLKPLIEAFVDQDFKKVNEIAERISKLEHEADIIKNNIREHLPKTLFMPVDRCDILMFLKEQDTIADRAEDLARMLEVRETKLPVELKEDVLRFTNKVIETVNALEVAAGELSEVIESSFGKHEISKVLKLIHNIDKKEWEADKLVLKLLRKLFEVENKLDPISVLHLERLIHTMDSVADHAENAGDRLRTMVARR